MKRLLILAFFLSSAFSVSSQPFPLKLKVATYNVGHFNQGWAGGFRFMGDPNSKKEYKAGAAEKQIAAWRQWISQQSLDFLCVQEWNQYFDVDSLFHAEKELLQPFYDNIYFGKAHSWIYNGIATNYTLSNLRTQYTFGDYYALIGDLKIGDKTITIISMHIPWQEDWHMPALEALIKDLKKYEYFICFGDTNSSDAEQMRFREAGFNMANGGYQGWFGTSGGKLTLEGRQGKVDTNIDNIITSANIKIMNVSAPHTGLNDLDHLPVIADVVITD